MLKKYFSLTGRASRFTYWTLQLLSFPVAYALSADLFPLRAPYSPAFYFFWIFFVFYVWSCFAVIVKRLHDRGKSGFWLLLGLIPICNIWLVVECGFLPGKAGSNEYGESLEKHRKVVLNQTTALENDSKETTKVNSSQFNNHEETLTAYQTTLKAVKDSQDELQKARERTRIAQKNFDDANKKS